ncbi:Profilin/allergen [Amniculicola lignicola CBS 123094]|uniref:Profilin n=1 Tax=Amniculicola lignicola CBS 123094 TaxID=1392246 RepID=A0A6A5WD88_9PLEO|nr:Profilin/allergen [Amniculicola lignicola CBS 123094]
MSWQAYVDTSLVGAGTLDKAIICDAAGSTVWASSAGFTIPVAELKAIAATFADKSEPKQVFSTGITINGEKYMTIGSDDTSLKLKKGKEGIIATKTTQALLIGHHDEDTQTVNANTTMESLAAYLREVGY